MPEDIGEQANPSSDAVRDGVANHCGATVGAVLYGPFFAMNPGGMISARGGVSEHSPPVNQKT